MARQAIIGKLASKYYLGVDLGNGYTKSRGLTFRSAVSKIGKNSKNKLTKDTFLVEYGEDTYVVGEGNDFTETGRHLSDEYLLCLLTAIAENYPKATNIPVCISVGLPLEIYLADDDTLKTAIEKKYSGETYTIRIKDKQDMDNNKDFREVKITITQLEVFMEGAYPIIKEDEREVAVIDVGMGTTNVAIFREQSVVGKFTIDGGMKGIYSELAGIIRSRYVNSGVTWEYIQKFFNKDTMKLAVVKENGKTARQDVDITFLREYIQSNITKQYGDIEKALPAIKNVEHVYLLGGGGKETEDFWKEHIEDVDLVDNPQAANSEVYDLVAQLIMMEEA